MQERYATAALTQAQTKAEFDQFLKFMRHNLDPYLDIVEGPVDPRLKAHVMLSYQDPALGGPERHLGDVLPEQDKANCSEQQKAALEASRLNSVNYEELRRFLAARAELITAGRLEAGAPFALPAEEPGLADSLRQALVRAPTLDPSVGYGIMAGSAALVTLGAGAALMGGGATAVAVAEAAPAALSVVQGGAQVVVRSVAAEEMRRAAGLAALSVVAGEAAAGPVQTHTAETLLPPLAGMNAGTDAMGERQQVDHISWRFTHLPAGDAGNSLAALAQRDRDNQMTGLGAHALLRADGSFERHDALCRDWGHNPQIQAGRNGNAIGLYVEGDGTLTPAQRQSLGRLETGFSGLCQASQAQPGELSPASYLEAEAWSGPRSAMPGMVMRPPVQQMRAAMGQ